MDCTSNTVKLQKKMIYICVGDKFFPPKKMRSVTTVIQNRETMIYSAPELHCTPHGSLGFTDIISKSKFLKKFKVPHSIISNGSSYHPSRYLNKYIKVQYLSNKELYEFGSIMAGCLKHFNGDLAKYMLKLSTPTDNNCEKWKNGNRSKLFHCSLHTGGLDMYNLIVTQII